jgi:hypothetical protein
LIWLADPSGERLTAHNFQYSYDCGTSGPYINYREVFGR